MTPDGSTSADDQKDMAVCIDEDMDEDSICRYCLDGLESGPLISPCQCRGGQKYVHLTCLRRWQRMVLVSQPTHPDFYGDDLRHQTCNVCNSSFTCAPPTRHELMESFTGPEIAALIEPGCVIGAHGVFSQELERKLHSMPLQMRHMCGYEHWIRGVYIITGVNAEDGIQRVPIVEREVLDGMRARLDGDLVLAIHGRRYRGTAAGSLSGVQEGDLPSALAALEVPCDLVLAQDPRPGCGEDHVVAVNVGRPLPGAPPKPRLVAAALEQVRARYPLAAKVEVHHFVGGPVESDTIASCLVLGGAQRGWRVVRDLGDAVRLACSLAARRCPEQGDFGGGQTVRVVGLRGRADLNGEVGLALSFAPGTPTGRWLVRLRNGEGVKVRPGNLEGGLGGAHGQVFCIWGDARWSRTQLLGEIARGHWGLCKASTADVTAPITERWQGLEGRMAFAPQTAMTEDFMRESEIQMTALRAEAARNHGIGDRGGAAGDEDGDEGGGSPP